MKLQEKPAPISTVNNAPIPKVRAGLRDLMKKQVKRAQTMAPRRRYIFSPGLTARPVRILLARRAEASVSVGFVR